MDIKYRRDLHQLLPDGAVCVELGVAEGYFSADILSWSKTKLLYMVDNWATISNQTGDGSSPKGWHDKNYSDAMRRVNFGIERVKVLRGITWEQAKYVDDESLDLVYIDACHSYECVMNDLRAWAPKVKQGGIIAGHDLLNTAYGVRQAVIEFTGNNFHVIEENKAEDAGFWFRKA